MQPSVRLAAGGIVYFMKWTLEPSHLGGSEPVMFGSLREVEKQSFHLSGVDTTLGKARWKRQLNY